MAHTQCFAACMDSTTHFSHQKAGDLIASGLITEGRLGNLSRDEALIVISGKQ